jgi:ActR/RegA family two-component response regulator
MKRYCTVWGAGKRAPYVMHSCCAAPFQCMQSRIYLVEDNPVILQWLAQARVVGLAATQTEACQWLNGHPDDWDAAVVDWWLAQGNGIHVIECLSTSPGQKIVVP